MTRNTVRHSFLCALLGTALLAPRVVAQEWKIAFNSARDGNYEVYVVNPDGSGLRNISRHAATDWVYHAREQLVMASAREGRHPRGAYDLYLVNVDSGELRRLTQFGVYDSYVGISPDERQFVVCSRKGGNRQLYIIDANGNELAQLTRGEAENADPDWSPDGSKIVFRSNRGGAFDIWVMNADGSDPVRLTEFAGNDEVPVHSYQGEGPPRWSPDGKHIAFMSKRGGDWDVYVMAADGSGLRNVTNNPAGADSYPSWSPDSRQLAFHSNRDGNYEIYVIKTDGTGLRRVTNHPGDDQGPVWVHAAKMAKPAARLSDFTWLEGSWRGRTTGGNNFVFDETWIESRGGVMLGMFRLTNPAEGDRVMVLEFITLRETAEGVEMRVRHFDTALNAWEKGDPIILKLVAAADARYEFENPVHNSPKRTVMTRIGDDAFTSRSEVIRGDGSVGLIQVQAERIKPPPPASK